MTEGKPVRQKIEVDSLSAYRFRNWTETVKSELKTINQARQVIEQATDRLAYAYLEAREEQERLINAGYTKAQVEAIAELPPVPVDATSIIRKAKNTQTTKEMAEVIAKAGK